MDVSARVEAALGEPVSGLRALGGGCVGEVYAAEVGGQRVVVKAGAPGSKLDVEGWMLRTLSERSSLPVPGVIHDEDTLLIMEFVESGGRVDAGAERHAADLLADLHTITAEGFGCDRDTLIGSLHQPNPWTGSWIEFFGEQRLVHMAETARERGALNERDVDAVRDLASRLGLWLDEPEAPSLIHGDVWGGNVLCRNGRIAAFIDPAVYYAHPEVELAFITLFGTFGEAFFARYAGSRRIREGFFETRRDLYNLYPLLVHAALFGGGYVSGVRSTLRRFARGGGKGG